MAVSIAVSLAIKYFFGNFTFNILKRVQNDLFFVISKRVSTSQNKLCHPVAKHLSYHSDKIIYSALQVVKLTSLHS